MVGLAAAMLTVHWQVGQWYMTLAAAVALIVSSWRYFMPVEFELNEQGVHQWCLGRRRSIPWHAIRGHRECISGVLLLPDDDHSLLASFRGLFVPYGIAPDTILAEVRHRVASPV